MVSRFDVERERKGVKRGVVLRDSQADWVDFQLFGEEAPGEGDGLFLEVAAKREIAQHFKEGVVPRGEPNIVKIVVLPCFVSL